MRRPRRQPVADQTEVGDELARNVCRVPLEAPEAV